MSYQKSHSRLVVNLAHNFHIFMWHLIFSTRVSDRILDFPPPARRDGDPNEWNVCVLLRARNNYFLFQLNEHTHNIRRVRYSAPLT
jgi:hypothetical protein